MRANEVKEKLIKALDLKVGDKIKINYYGGIKVCEIKKELGYICLIDLGKSGLNISLSILLECGFSKIEIIGDKLCEDFATCVNCPLRSCDCGDGQTLYEKLEDTKKRYSMPEGVYNEYKKLLDKEVV